MRISRLASRSLDDFGVVLASLVRQGRPRRGTAEEMASELALCTDLLGVATALLGQLHLPRQPVRSLVLGAYLRLRAVHPALTQQRFCRALTLPERTLHSWLRTFNRYGFTGLEQPRKAAAQGRRGAAAVLKQQRLMEVLHARPQAYDINRASWSIAALAVAYRKQYGETISRTTVGRLVRKSGYTIKKARRVLSSPDPDYREKVELLLHTLRSLKPGELFFFVDELGPLRVKKYGGRIIVRKEESPTIPQVQPDRGSLTMAGALSATTNQVTWIYTPSKDSRAMVDLIEILFNQHARAQRLYITWDAASWHDSALLVEWLDTFNAETLRSGLGPTIHLVPLPTSSQFLDVIEAVFSGMKRAVIHHSNYQSVLEMKHAISRHFVERNAYFRENPKRAGNKIWNLDFFDDAESLRSGNYREW